MTDIMSILGNEADDLLGHVCKGIPRQSLHLPGPDFVDRVVAGSDRSPAVLRSLQQMFGHGRLAGTGYLSILPVDQGIEHSAGASFAKNPLYFDPENIVKLAIEGGCNAVASTLGVLGAVRAQVRAQDPVPAEVQPQRVPDLPEQVRPDHVRQHRAGARHGRRRRRRDDLLRFAGIEPADRRGQPGVRAWRTSWAWPRCCGATCATRRFKLDKDYHVSADLTGQANHLGVTIEADIIKQKLPENNGGYLALNTKENPYGKNDKRMYSELATDHPIDLTRYQVANCYMGRAGLINSGGASGANDLHDAVRTAVINKRAGGMGLISGRKAFQKPMADGVTLLNAIQDVYLSSAITVA